jgi:hypothetical protein
MTTKEQVDLLEGEMTPRAWLKREAARAKKYFRFYYQSVARKVEVDGQEIMVEFHCLGCNASHWFYVGILPDGRLVERWFGEESERRWVENGKEYYEPVCGEGYEVLAVGEYPGYLGHR